MSRIFRIAGCIALIAVICLIAMPVSFAQRGGIRLTTTVPRDNTLRAKRGVVGDGPGGIWDYRSVNLRNFNNDNLIIGGKLGIGVPASYVKDDPLPAPEANLTVRGTVRVFGTPQRYNFVLPLRGRLTITPNSDGFLLITFSPSTAGAYEIDFIWPTSEDQPMGYDFASFNFTNTSTNYIMKRISLLMSMRNSRGWDIRNWQTNPGSLNVDIYWVPLGESMPLQINIS